MSCECDIKIFPRPLAVRAGLTSLTRQLGAFPEWRQAVLAAIGRETALDDWNSREPQHLGLMLVDFWAYVCDVISFYDGAVAGEAYLRTAALRPSRRKLVGLLGYVPRPAVGATAFLSLTAEGRKLITVPAGTKFRSTGFNGHPPQVFELGGPTVAHPLNNKWPLARVVPTQLNPYEPEINQALGSFLVVPATLRAAPGDRIAVVAGTVAEVRSVLRIEPVMTLARQRFARVVLSSSVGLPGSTAYAAIALQKPSSRAGVWTLPTASVDDPAIGASYLVLDGLHRGIAAGHNVIVTVGGVDHVRTVSAVEENSRVFLANLTSTLTTGSGASVTTSTLVSPNIKVAVTRVTFTTSVPAGATATTTSVWYGLLPAGRVVAQPLDTLGPLDPIRIDGIVETPPVAPGELMLLDVNGAGVKASGQVDFATRSVTLASDATWSPALAAPVTMFGNTLTVTRGEAVHNETLGVGDASQSLQTFKLAKKPLTYLPGDGGLISTLEIHVDGLRWEETPSFFTATSQDRVFTVRADDEEQTLVTFGGGARLATGSVVAANYRFGAGVAAPPAGTITQLAKPIKGLKSVNNPLAAFGGGDREGSEELLAYAPRSALLLGRAISLVDFEAAAAAVAGVRAVAAEWRFSAAAQRPLVHIYFIGNTQLRATVFQQLRDLSDPTVPLMVETATGDSTRLDLSITVSPDYESSRVLNAVRDSVFAAATTPGTGGLLRPERLGVGKALFESWISETVIETEGVQSLDAILINAAPFTNYGIRPPTGHYFDFETGGVVINGKAGYV